MILKLGCEIFAVPLFAALLEIGDIRQNVCSMDYVTLAYYSLTLLENPLHEIERHKEFFKTRDFKGRIYISEQGINGQASALASDADAYIDWMHQDPRFASISFKKHPSSEHSFPKMTVKYRSQLVAIDCPVDFSLGGEKIPPSQWKKMLEEKSEETVLLDVRNDYEWKIGHFEGAELPPLENFREFPSYAKKLKETCDPKSTPVMMYCTGGIRCEFYSALLKQEGFEKVYQLDGGVIQYGLEEGTEHWKGKLFVFDDRLAVPLEEGVDPIAHCSLCQTPNDVYHNCANMDCNELFLCCASCLPKFQGCCSEDCLHEGRVRPYQENGKPFRKVSHDEKALLCSCRLKP
jgi:UPF0176 protein